MANILGISPVAITTLVSAFGAPAASHFAAGMIPSLPIPYEGEVLMVGSVVGALIMLKSLKGWAKIIMLILMGVVFTVGLTRSTFLGGIGGEA